MSARKRSSYTQEFKIDAVRLVRGGQIIAAVAQTLEIADQTLNNWVKAEKQGKLGVAFAKAYGWPQIGKALRARIIAIGKERVCKLMQRHSIQAHAKRKYKATTAPNHSLPIALNLLNRQFAVKQPDRAWSSDITYIASEDGWPYLTVVLDLFSRQVVGWSMRPPMKTELVGDALRMARFRCHTEAGLIFYSDRGSQ